jgi:hypothetical protein
MHARTHKEKLERYQHAKTQLKYNYNNVIETITTQPHCSASGYTGIVFPYYSRPTALTAAASKRHCQSMFVSVRLSIYLGRGSAVRVWPVCSAVFVCHGDSAAGAGTPARTAISAP